MPLNSLLLGEQLRRHWQVVGATLVLLLFLVVHFAVFQPAASRYRKALKRAQDLGLTFDPEQHVAMMPPRVLALLTENSLPATAADMQRESGVLTATLLDDLTQLTNRHSMVVLATQPGAMSHEDKAVQVRAHLKLQCSFDEFAGFLDDLSRSHTLTSVDRFSMVGGMPGRHTVELWVTRYILKQTGKSGT
jgi:hypothetical protein